MPQSLSNLIMHLKPYWLTSAVAAIGIELNKIILFPGSGAPAQFYSVSAAGLAAAIAAAVATDVIWIPPSTIPGNYIIPAGVEVVGDGNTNSILSGTITNNGSVGNIGFTGNLINNGGVLYCSITVSNGIGITQTLSTATITYTNIGTYATATYGIYITGGRVSNTTVGGDLVCLGIYANEAGGQEINIFNSRFRGKGGGQVENATLVSSCTFYGQNNYDGLLHTTGTCRVVNCSCYSVGGTGYGINLTAGGFTSVDNNWNSSFGGATNLTWGTGDRGAYSVEDYHANDIETNVLTRHNPLPGDEGGVPISDGDSWTTATLDGAPDVYSDLLTALGYSGYGVAAALPPMMNQEYPSIASMPVGGTTYQATAYWDRDRYLVVATRELDGDWALYKQTIQVTGDDNHDYATVGIDSTGIIHLTYGMHNDALLYRKSNVAISTWTGTLGNVIAMLGTNETDVTYPRFYNDPSDGLYFIFRDGGAGNGDTYFYKYNTGTSSWAAATGTGAAGLLIEGTTGVPTQNAYPDILSFDSDFGSGGFMHLSWVWRALGATREHDVSYVKWDGTNWKQAGGAAQTVPITLANCEIVDSATAADNLTGVNSNYSDSSGNPLIVYLKEGGDGFRHIYSAYYSAGWTITQISDSENPIPVADSFPDMRSPIVLIDRATDTAYIFYRDSFDLPGILAYKSDAADFTTWTKYRIYPYDLGNVRLGVDLREWAENTTVYFVLPFWGDYWSSYRLALPIRIMKWDPAINQLYPTSAAVTLFNDAEGDPVDVDRTARADGTSAYASRRDHRHELGTVNLGDLSDVDDTGAGTGDIIYKTAGDWEDYPLGIGSNITNDGSSINIGDVTGGNYLSVDLTSGEIGLNGNAVVFEDLRVEPTVRQAAGAGVPAFEKYFDDSAGTSKGVYLHSFTDEAVAGNEKEVFFQMQMPHAWKIGSDIHVHVHFVPAATVNSSDIIWGLEYCWKSIGEVFGDTVIIQSSTTLLPDDANITAGKHYLAEFADISPGPTASSLSSILIGRLFRNSSAAGDTYTNKVGLLYIDAHYEIDSLGSTEEYSKTVLIADSDGETILDSDGVEITE